MMRYLFLLFLLAYSDLSAFAENELIFEHFQRKEGLSNNSVRQIYQDSKGFLWFGTLNGLNKYDGVRITTYQYHRGKPGTISGNRIAKLEEDQLGSLWIITNDGTAQMYDELNDAFVSLNDYLTTETQKNLVISNLYPYKQLELYLLTSNSGLLQVFLNPDKSIRDVKYYSTQSGLPDNQIRSIYYDTSGITWIGTRKGLVHLKKGVITPVVLSGETGSTPFNMIVSTILDVDSALIFGTNRNGIYQYSKGTNELKFNTTFKALNGINIPSIVTAGKEYLYFTTYGNGLWRFDQNSQKLRQIKLPPITSKQMPDIHEVYVDSKGIVWMETSERGLYQYNPVNNKVKYFPLNAEKRQAIGDAEKIIQFEDSFGDLWVGIYGGGICKFNRNKNEFEQYMFDARNPFGITSDYVLAIHEDNSKNLWIGTYRGGLNKLKLKPDFFNVGQPIPNANLKIENEVRSLVVDSKNHLWMGTKSGKVYAYDNNHKQLAVLPDDLGINNQFNEAGVYCLMEDRNGNLWIGTKGEGIYVVKGAIQKTGISSLKNCEVVHFKNDPAAQNDLSDNDIYDLLEIGDNQIWVATHNQGLSIIKNPWGKLEFENYSAGSGPNALSSNLLRCFLKDRYNNVWIGSENGLNIVERKFLNNDQLEFRSLFSDPENPESLSNNDVLTVNELSNGQIWCGTFGGGVNYLENYNGNIDSLKWIIRTTENGLASNLVYQIVEDHNTDLWLSTDYGISTYSLRNKEFKTYHTKEQQETNAYSENAGDIFEGGKMVFGQVNGFTSFTPDSIIPDPKAYPIYITDLYIDNERIVPGANSVLDKVISHTSSLSLHHNQNFITFEYAVLDYANPTDINYSYMLEGFEKDWNHVGNISRANYKGLPPGEYVLKVKGTNSDGIENSIIKQIDMEIRAPWWKTGIAFFAYSLFLLSLIFVIGYFILRQLQLQNLVKLEKETTDNKLRFYTNISHELKTPLTLIQGPAEELIHSRNLPESAKFKATEILRNAKRLLELIDQLIDFRKIQKGHIPLKVTQLDITEFIRGIYISFLPLAEKRKINFLFEPKESIVGYIDVDKIEKIIFNLISNAFKHTQKDKSIRISFDSSNGFSFSVKDEGSGIDPADLPHIFQRFKLFTKSSHIIDSSSGIGLSITQELVNVHKGKIDVESKLGEGSIFTVTIPIKKSDYSSEEIDDNTSQNVHLYDHTEEFIEDMDIQIDNDPDLEKRYAGPDASSLLIIEDNDDLRKYLYFNLKPFYNISQAENGLVGLEKARKGNFDLIICDVMMPEMDGIEVSKNLKTDFNTSHIPIILLTAKTSDEQKQEGLETGADAYITKPFSLKLLKIQVRNLIESRKKLLQKFGKKAEVSAVDLGGTNADQQFLTKVIKIIEEKMSDPDFNVNSIVKEFGYGRTVFYKKIKGIAGYAPNDFVRIIRMKKAASALRNTDLTVAEISYMTGFNDSNYFSRTFKKHFGKTPSQYRRG